MLPPAAQPRHGGSGSAGELRASHPVSGPLTVEVGAAVQVHDGRLRGPRAVDPGDGHAMMTTAIHPGPVDQGAEIGRASCRERVESTEAGGASKRTVMEHGEIE